MNRRGVTQIGNSVYVRILTVIIYLGNLRYTVRRILRSRAKGIAQTIIRRTINNKHQLVDTRSIIDRHPAFTTQNLSISVHLHFSLD